LVVALIFVTIPCGVVALATSGFYYRHSAHDWDSVQEHQFNVRGQDAEVLFIGDSSLAHGVSPEELTRETGRSVYNLGVPAPGLAVNHELLLRRYLAQNRRPTLIVLYLTATTRTRPPYAVRPAWYDGETMLLRYGDSRQIVDFFGHNEVEIGRFIALSGLGIAKFDWSDRSYYERAKALDSSHGYVPLRLEPGRVLGADSCPLSGSAIQPDEEFIKDFRLEAADLGIKAAVYLAPVPDCDPAFAATSAIYGPLVDNEPYTLPHELFRDDPSRAHLGAQGAGQNSRIVAEFLRHFETGSAARSATALQTRQDGVSHP
jgi:hypothetical protein